MGNEINMFVIVVIFTVCAFFANYYRLVLSAKRVDSITAHFMRLHNVGIVQACWFNVYF